MAFFNVLRSLSPTLILGRTTFQKSKVKAEKVLMCRRRNFQEKKSFFKDLGKKIVLSFSSSPMMIFQALKRWCPMHALLCSSPV